MLLSTEPFINRQNTRQENTVENPEFAMVILEALCKQIVGGEPGAVAALVGHLEKFSRPRLPAG